MKKMINIILFVSFIFFLQGCSKSRIESLINSIDSICIEDKQMDLLQFLGDSYMYGFADLNGDKKEDWIVKKDNQLFIIDLETNNVVYTGYTYEQVFEDGDKTGIFYERPGGAPLHTDYQVFIFDEAWNCSTENIWSLYDCNFDDDYDENDMYIWNGEELSYEEWSEKTMTYKNYDKYFIKMIEVTK